MPSSRTRNLALACICLIAPGCGSNSTAALLERLRDANPQVRRSAASELANHPEAAAEIVPTLEGLFGDADMPVRMSAALAIQKLDPKNQRFSEVLIESLRAGNGPMFVEVGRMGHEAKWAVPTLVEQLSHPQPQFRALAARAIGQIGVTDRNIESALQQRLRDSTLAVQKAARIALDQLHTQPVPDGAKHE